MLIGCLGGIIVKVLKGTGREGFLLKLWIAWIWGPWVAPPASEGALCFAGFLHAAFRGTFSNNQKVLGSLGLSTFKLHPQTEKVAVPIADMPLAIVFSRPNTSHWAWGNFLSSVTYIWDSCPKTSLHLAQHFNIYQWTTCSWCTCTAQELIFKKYI